MEYFNFQTVLTSLVTALASSGLLTLYLHERIKHKYEQEIKRLESELARQTFRYSKVFETTEKTIADVHRKLLKLLEATQDFLDLDASVTKKQFEDVIISVKVAIKELHDASYYNRIYLPRDTYAKILELFLSFKYLTGRHSEAEFLLQSRFPNEEEERKRFIQLKLHGKRMKYDDIPRLLMALETDFQRILGFPIDDKK